MRYGWLLFGFLLLGCEKEIHIEVPVQEGRVVVYSFLYPDSAVSFHLSESVSITSPDLYAYVENARVGLKVNGSVQLDQAFPFNTVNGKWDPVVCNYGDSLIVEVSIPGKPLVLARTMIPKKVAIAALDTVTEVRRPGNGEENAYLRFALQFKEDGLRSDFYQVVVVRESWDYDGVKRIKTLELLQEDPVFVFHEQGGGLSSWFDFRGLFSDVLINGQDYTVTFLTQKKDYLMAFDEQRVRLTVYLYHHTYDYFEYLKTTIWAKGADNFPVFDPVRIHSNVDQGLGLVSGMSFDQVQYEFNQ